jgi:hypothetical protein
VFASEVVVRRSQAPHNPKAGPGRQGENSSMTQGQIVFWALMGLLAYMFYETNFASHPKRMTNCRGERMTVEDCYLLTTPLEDMAKDIKADDDARRNDSYRR